MGKRILRVTPELFVESLKLDSGQKWRFTVENALPKDAHFVGAVWDPLSEIVKLIIESDDWEGDSGECLPCPVTRLEVS